MAALLQPRRSRSNRALLEAIVPVGLRSMEKNHFFLTPWYSSTVLVAMVVATFAESVTWV